MSATESTSGPADGHDAPGSRSAFRIRDLDPADEAEIDTVTRMCMTTVLETIPEFGHDAARARRALPNFTFAAMREMIRGDLGKPTHRFLVAVDGAGHVVGHSMISRKVADDGRRYGYFFSRYVRPEHRRRGVASLLMDEALRWFRDDDWDHLLAHTHARNDALRRLFERYGFHVVERRDAPWPSLTLRLDRDPVRSQARSAQIP